MTFTPHGKHLINGEWVATEPTFNNSPADGPVHTFSTGNANLVDKACHAAEGAFLTYGYSPREKRAFFLDAIADEIEARGDAITEIGTQETGLPEARMQGERGRTSGQLRLFAEHIRDGRYLDRHHDEALPNRSPLPRPDLKLVERPIGPVAVFGASNFPLAFSTAGGDTAAALAAGCPVVVKGHEAHPGTGEIIAEAIHAAINKTGEHPGVFSMIHGGTQAVGAALVQHPLIRAVGFTGSLRGGRALFDMCAQRPEPIPFFGELGSVNPMFVLPGAVQKHGEEIGAGWAASLTMGAGQFCTNPGIAIVENNGAGDAFVAAAKSALESTAAQTMLTDGIAAAYQTGKERFDTHSNTSTLLSSADSGRMASPCLYETDAENYLQDKTLGEEVFGPLGLVIRVENLEQMRTLANNFEGQLTITLQMDDADTEAATTLIPVMERKAGRLLVNGFPTGVEVAAGMVHGGPYPASTNFGATSVGTLAIRRFLRPVCYQNFPGALLPIDLK